MNPPPVLISSPLLFNHVTVRASVTPVILQVRVAEVPEPTSRPAIVTSENREVTNCVARVFKKYLFMYDN